MNARRATVEIQGKETAPKEVAFLKGHFLVLVQTTQMNTDELGSPKRFNWSHYLYRRCKIRFGAQPMGFTALRSSLQIKSRSFQPVEELFPNSQLLASSSTFRIIFIGLDGYPSDRISQIWNPSTLSFLLLLLPPWTFEERTPWASTR